MLNTAKPVSWLLVLLTAIAIPATATAQNLRFLEDAPIANFTPEDTEQFKSTLYDALDNGKDGETRRWKNEKSGAFGGIKVEESLSREDRICRRVRIENTAKGRHNVSYQTFCRRGNEAWQAKP